MMKKKTLRSSSATPSISTRDGSESGNNKKLVEATMKHDLKTLTSLLKKKKYSNIHQPDGLGRVALIEACRAGDKECVEILVAVDSKIDGVFDLEGKTALHIAARLGHQECVVSLLKSVNYTAIDSKGSTAVHDAAKHGQTNIIRSLLAYGASPEDLDEDGNTAIILACRNGRVETVNALLMSGANVNGKSGSGKTALMFACEDGNSRLVELLLKQGAKFNEKDHLGRTAAEYCLIGASSNHQTCLSILPPHADLGNKQNVPERSAQVRIETSSNEKALQEEIGRLNTELQASKAAIHVKATELVTVAAARDTALADIETLKAQLLAYGPQEEEDDITFSSDDDDLIPDETVESISAEEKQINKLKKENHQLKKDMKELEFKLKSVGGEAVPLSLHNDVVRGFEKKLASARSGSSLDAEEGPSSVTKDFYRTMLLLAYTGQLPGNVKQDLDSILELQK